MNKMTELILEIFDLGFQWKTLDPFMFCVHHHDLYPAGNAKLGLDAGYLAGRRIGEDFTPKDGFRMYHGKSVPGFPGHPHVGFETVTIVKQGFVDHSDSLGGAGRYGNGDVQWMTAGKGIQHSEMFPLLNDDKPNSLELFQIWLNLPAKSKQVEPHFTMFWQEDIPVVNGADGARVAVIAGSVEGIHGLTPPPDSWAFPNDNEVMILGIELPHGSSVKLPAAHSGVNRVIYKYGDGDLRLTEQVISGKSGIILNPFVTLDLKADSGTVRVLLLQGKPIGEPVVQYGPFVATDEYEIQQVIQSYQKTQFGGWPWPGYDHVHDKSATRFAKFHNGEIVQK